MKRSDVLPPRARRSAPLRPGRPRRARHTPRSSSVRLPSEQKCSGSKKSGVSWRSESRRRIAEQQQTHSRREALIAAIASSERALDEDVLALESMRGTLREADDSAAALRATVDEQDVAIRQSRRALEEIRAEAGDLEVARATAESDLTHLAQACVDAVQNTLDEVLAQVEQMEQSGQATPDAAALSADEPDPEADEESLARRLVRRRQRLSRARPPMRRRR